MSAAVLFDVFAVSSVCTGALLLCAFAAKKLAAKNLALRTRTYILNFILIFQPLSLLSAIIMKETNICLADKSHVQLIEDTQNMIITGLRSEILYSENSLPDENIIASAVYKTNLRELAAYIWISVMIIFLLYMTVKYMIFKRRIIKNTTCKITGFSSKLRIFKSGEAGSPFLMGFFKPVIILPDIFISGNELMMIIRHENAHYKRHDNLKKLYANILICVNWFNPVFRLLPIMADEISDLAADEIAVSGYSREKRKEYGNVLLKFAGGFDKQPMQIISSLSAKAKKLANRLECIMTEKKSGGNKLVATLAAIIMTAALGASVSAGAVVCEIRESNNQKPVAGFEMLKVIGKKLPNDYYTYSADFFPEESMYEVCADYFDSAYIVSDIAYGNGNVIVLNTEEGDGIYFKQGQCGTVKISINLSSDYSADKIGELVEVGFIYENNLTELYYGRVGLDGLAVKFTAPYSGNYMFYTLNCCAGLQNYNYVMIKK